MPTDNSSLTTDNVAVDVDNLSANLTPADEIAARECFSKIATGGVIGGTIAGTVTAGIVYSRRLFTPSRRIVLVSLMSMWGVVASGLTSIPWCLTRIHHIPADQKSELRTRLNVIIMQHNPHKAQLEMLRLQQELETKQQHQLGLTTDISANETQIS